MPICCSNSSLTPAFFRAPEELHDRDGNDTLSCGRGLFLSWPPGLLLLVNRYVPLALTVLAAEIVNILTTHILVMHGSGLLPVPILVVFFWILVFWRVRSAFGGIFQAKVPA